jgi:hypothetical protein
MTETNSSAMSKTVASEQEKLQTVDRDRLSEQLTARESKFQIANTPQEGLDYEALIETYKQFNEAIMQQTMLIDSSGRNGWGVVAPPPDNGEQKKKRRCVVS